MQQKYNSLNKSMQILTHPLSQQSLLGLLTILCGSLFTLSTLLLMMAQILRYLLHQGVVLVQDLVQKICHVFSLGLKHTGSCFISPELAEAMLIFFEKKDFSTYRACKQPFLKLYAEGNKFEPLRE
jgi:hypothetical protein